MKILFFALVLTTPCIGGEPLDWIKSDGTTIEGEWKHGDENSVTILVPVKIPLNDLNVHSRKQALAIASMMKVINKVESRIDDISEFIGDFEKLYSEREGNPTPEWRQSQKKLLHKVEKRIQNNGSTVDACFVQLADATKAAGKKNDRHVAKSMLRIALILLGSK